MSDKQEPVQINAGNFRQWVAAMQSVGLYVIPYEETRPNDDLQAVRGSDSET